MIKQLNLNTLRARFRGFYPVVIDVETAGLNASINPLLEIAVATLKMDNNGWLTTDVFLHFHIKSFPGAILEKSSLIFNKIDPDHPFRNAVHEYEALCKIFNLVGEGIKTQLCSQAIIVAHNAFFDHSFLMAAIERSNCKNNLFHPFSTLDTAALSALVLGETVLAKACKSVGIIFDNEKAHSALYDAECTAALFCELVNRWKRFGGWPIV